MVQFHLSGVCLAVPSLIILFIFHW
jgi:hypothetical protein